MKTNRRENGFSLIEIIITLVLVGVAATIIMPFYQAGVSDSPVAVQRADAGVALYDAMEEIIDEYYQIAYDNTWQSSGDEYDYMYEEVDGFDHRKTRGAFIGLMDSSSPHTYGKSGENPGSKTLAQFRSSYDGTTITKNGISISVTTSAMGKLSQLASPQVSIPGAVEFNDGFTMTLSTPDGGSLTYIFTTGGNFPAFLSS